MDSKLIYLSPGSGRDTNKKNFKVKIFFKLCSSVPEENYMVASVKAS